MSSTATLTATTAFRLQTGDRLVTIGGKANGRDFKRYSMGGARVVEVWAAPGARTLVHLKLDNGSVFKLRHDYPMQITPNAEVEEALVTQAQRVEAAKADPAVQARIAARRAARR